MNLITFKYTKADGKQSERVLAPLIIPNTMYEGIDISELSMEQQALFVQEVSDAKQVYLGKLAEIQNKFDVKTMYRRFDPSKMTNVVKENI